MRQTHKKIGQVKFFQACEALRTHREEIEKTCANLVQAAGFLSGKIVGNVSAKSTLLDIMEATGIKLSFPRKPSGGDTTKQSSKDKAVIIACITKLANEFNILLPAEFVELHQRTLGKPYKPTLSVDVGCPPIPVASVSPSSTLPITKKT